MTISSWPPVVADIEVAPLFDIAGIIDRTYPKGFSTEDGTGNNIYVQAYQEFGDSNNYLRIVDPSNSIIYDLTASELWGSGGSTTNCLIVTENPVPLFDAALGHLYVNLGLENGTETDFRIVVVDVTDGTVFNRSNVLQGDRYWCSTSHRQFFKDGLVYSVNSSATAYYLSTTYDPDTNVLTEITGGIENLYLDRPAGTCTATFSGQLAVGGEYNAQIIFYDGTEETYIVRHKMKPSDAAGIRGTRAYANLDSGGGSFYAIDTSLDATEYYDLVDVFLSTNFGVTEPVWRKQ